MTTSTASRALCAVAIAVAPLVVKGATSGYSCKFKVFASPSGLANHESPFELNFVTDTKTKKAYLLGNNDSAEVQVILNAEGVTFVEITNSGNVMVTAISKTGEAVHSRNSIVRKGELVPSQYYGSCDPR